MNLRIRENCSYFFNGDIELLMAAASILSNNADSVSFFDEEKIAKLREKFYFLFDTANLLEENIFFRIVGLVVEMGPNVTLNELEERLLTEEHKDLLQFFLCLREIDENVSCEELYKNNKQCFKSYLGCAALYNETNRLIEEFFDLASELNNELLKMSHIQKDRESAAKAFAEELEHADPLEFSQKLMGKTFFNRGPYQHFYFAHSLFTPNKKSIRYFGLNQVFFYPLYAVPIKENDIINNLRALADSTRFKILLLLKENKTMRGMDIASSLGLTSPTISHHISELKSSGLLHEEQVKNTKYYSVNTNRLSEIINVLDSMLK